MANVGRNQPCPCGSGKKYKKCCLADHEAACLAAQPPPPQLVGTLDASSYDQLDEISNGALDLIHAGHFDEAEKMCQQLLRDFPDVFDGHMRLGQLHRARGNPKKAAYHLRLAAAIARSPDYHPDLALSLDAEADELNPPAV